MKRNHIAASPVCHLFCFVFTLFMLIVITGCPAVGPDYVRPDTPSPEKWQADMQNGLKAEDADARGLARWWTTLNDAVLSELIERALAGNLDLKTARARVWEARAQRGVSKSAYFPTLDASGSYLRTFGPESQGYVDETDLSNVSLDAGWELDLFGGTRRSVEAAGADLEASHEALNSTLVSMLAEIALNYIDLRTLQARIALAEASLTAQRQTYQLTRSRFEAGLSNERAYQTARYTLSGIQATIPTLKTGLSGALNRLAVLLGETPGTLDETLGIWQAIPVPPKDVAVGVPADTLRNRPDVRRAERQLAAQTARIGVAKSDLFPKIRLTGSIGYEATESGDLFDQTNHFWYIGPGIQWRIFSGGAILRNIEVQTARQEQTLLNFKSSVLKALEEVENALNAYANEQNRMDALSAAKTAASRAYDLALDQYQAGLVDFDSVLTAQRSLLSFQDQLAVSEGTVTMNLVRLYKSMGGGWNCEAEK